MGLDIILYEGVKPHQCDTRETREIKNVFKRKMSFAFSDETYIFTTKDSIEEAAMHLFTPHTESYVCECADSGNLVNLRVGYRSCLNMVKYPYFGPYEYERSDSFYFGSYITFFRCTRAVPILSNFTSDCDGYYGGEELLTTLRSQLEDAEDPLLVKYFSLLDGKDLSNCIIQHA